MTDAELLAKVKKGLGITGTFQDDTLNVYIADVKAFLIDAGVRQSVLSNEASAGCVMRGVADLWNYVSGNATLSDFFRMRMLQLKALAVVTITRATWTTVSVTRDGQALTSGNVVSIGDVLTISVTGGTITVNGSQFTSGETYIVSGDVSIVSTADEEVQNG